MASVAERVIDIVAEQLGVDKEKITPETSVCERFGGRLARYGRAGDGARGRVRHQHSRRRREKIQTVGQAIKFIEEAQNS